MKNLKLLILAFGALGLLSLLMEFTMFKELLMHPFALGALGLCLIGGFALPFAMGVMGMTKPPMLMWQVVVALAGFLVIAIKFKVWQDLSHIMDEPMTTKLMVIADIGGVVVSALALAKPEKA